MSDETALVTRTCAACGFPVHAPADAPCPFCHRAQPAVSTLLHSALYDLSLADLYQLKAAPATLVERLDDASIETTLPTILDVLLTIYVISEEPAPDHQLRDVIAKVIAGHLDELPLPRRGPCFCHSGKRYKKCHGRAT